MSICKASEIPRNEAYVKGIWHKAEGTKETAVYDFP